MRGHRDTRSCPSCWVCWILHTAARFRGCAGAAARRGGVPGRAGPVAPDGKGDVGSSAPIFRVVEGGIGHGICRPSWDGLGAGGVLTWWLSRLHGKGVRHQHGNPFPVPSSPPLPLRFYLLPFSAALAFSFSAAAPTRPSAEPPPFPIHPHTSPLNLRPTAPW